MEANDIFPIVINLTISLHRCYCKADIKTCFCSFISAFILPLLNEATRLWSLRFPSRMTLTCLMRVVCETCFRGVLGCSTDTFFTTFMLSRLWSLVHASHIAKLWTPPEHPCARIMLEFCGLPFMITEEKKRYPWEVLRSIFESSFNPGHLKRLSTVSRKLLILIFSMDFCIPWTVTSKCTDKHIFKNCKCLIFS